MKAPIVLLALAFATGCGSANSSNSSTAVSHHQPTPSSENDLPNFHTVHPFLMRSGDIVAGDMAELKSLAVRSILSLEDEGGDSALADVERQAAATQDIAFKWQPMSPSAQPTLAQINKALLFITTPANQPVLVHCKHGSDRTGIVLAAYRIRYDHWTKAQAVAEMKEYGHYSGLFWWDDILDQVQ